MHRLHFRHRLRRISPRQLLAPFGVAVAFLVLLALNVPYSSTVTDPSVVHWLPRDAAASPDFHVFPNGSLVYNGQWYTPTTSPAAHSEWDHLLRPSSSKFWLFFILSLACITMAGLAAGLTMGLVSVDAMKLHVTLEADLSDDEEVEEEESRDAARKTELLAKADELHRKKVPAGHPDLLNISSELEKLKQRKEDREVHFERKREKENARRLLPIVSKHHLLLVTLLLANAIANECMPIFLDQIVPSWLAVLLSVSFVLIFGEIVPSAIFTGKNQLTIASFFTPFVWSLIAITSPISYPISKLLDAIFGEEEHGAYDRGELKAFIRMHGHHDQHQAVVVLRPHDNQSLPPLHPLTDEEKEEAINDANILNMKGPDGEPLLAQARFSTTNCHEFTEWLNKEIFLPASFTPSQEWSVIMHPMSNERLYQNKPRVHIGFASLEDAVTVCDLINRSISAPGGGAWLHGWIRIEAEVAEQQQVIRMQKLAADECAILCGVIEIGEKRAGEAAHLLYEQLGESGAWKIFMLGHNTILDRGVLAEVMQRGHSRIPIYYVSERVVELVRQGDEPFGFQLVDKSTTEEPTWGRWNCIGSVTFASPAAKAGITTDDLISAVNGFRVRNPKEYHQRMAAVTGDRVSITVYRKDEYTDRKYICGMLLAKRLLVIGPEDYRQVSDITERYPLAVSRDESLLEVLSRFRVGRSHMAIVTNNPEGLQQCWNDFREARLADMDLKVKRKRTDSTDGDERSSGKSTGDPLQWAAPLSSGKVEVYGIITLEDVLEEFMGDIADETDLGQEISRMHRRTRTRRVGSAVKHKRQLMELAARTPLIKSPVHTPMVSSATPRAITPASQSWLRSGGRSGLPSRSVSVARCTSVHSRSGGQFDETTPLLTSTSMMSYTDK